jgi:hypothetical protein
MKGERPPIAGAVAPAVAADGPGAACGVVVRCIGAAAGAVLVGAGAE